MRHLVIAIVCSLLLGQSLSAADLAPLPIDTLIRQLADDDFAARESAAEGLATRGAEAIESLVVAAQGDSPEVSSRAVALLERLMMSEEAGTVDAADAALTRLADADQPQASALATAALERHALVREQRTVAKIEELGGQVQYAPDIDPFGRPLGMLPNDPNDPTSETTPLRPRTILLGRNWKGGTEGLNYLRRLAHREDLILYIVQGSGVPLTEAQALASVLPGLVVHHRGPYLGVGTITDGQTVCVIGDVKPDGPADRAGLQRDDIVRTLNGMAIGNFFELVENLKQFDEGDTVTISVQRVDRQTFLRSNLDIKVELGTWELPRVADDVDTGMRFPPQMFPPPQFPRPPMHLPKELPPGPPPQDPDRRAPPPEEPK